MQILSVRSQGMTAVAQPRRTLPPAAPAQPPAPDRRAHAPQSYQPVTPTRPAHPGPPPRGVFIDTYA